MATTITYTQQGDYLLPDLQLPEQPKVKIGVFGQRHKRYLKEHHRLDRFDKEANFFDNISCIDNFFAEYRNITFALQASLKHTDYFSIYERNRDKYLTDHWFVEKRNETTKQKPFQLVYNII